MARKPADTNGQFQLEYHSCRNITCPEDEVNGRRVLCGRVPATSLLELPTDENVRDYLLGVEGKKRKRPTDVHRRIKDTLENYPYNFPVLNGGVVIVARGYDVDEKTKRLSLKGPSIINGAQTQGVLRDFYRDLQANEDDLPVIYVTYELIVTNDEDLISETSIARNSQNSVEAISIVGSLGQLEELEKKITDAFPGLKLKKSETDVSDDYLPTERLLQVITALVPDSLYLRQGKESSSASKAYAFSQKARCLKEFREIYEIANSKKELGSNSKLTIDDYKELYQFYLDIAPEAYDLYLRWKSHQGFKGTRLKGRKGKDKDAFKRDENGNILEIPDGVVFPILASFSAFVAKSEEGWKIDFPPSFQEKILIEAAKRAFMEMASSDPPTMGKSKACYLSLHEITSLYKSLTS
ncbi:AIPR family protein [Leptolyngbya sp. PCC 6406]|uniref:AIPR family protein n=1 Tax=Leptolyngbya sp. PCC 6406 TaxID=1173264 RepID=UPI0002AC2582|nr:AIPR family protein [Leptolyngbya sp. PCC 6406]